MISSIEQARRRRRLNQRIRELIAVRRAVGQAAAGAAGDATDPVDGTAAGSPGPQAGSADQPAA